MACKGFGRGFDTNWSEFGELLPDYSGGSGAVQSCAPGTFLALSRAVLMVVFAWGWHGCVMICICLGETLFSLSWMVLQFIG